MGQYKGEVPVFARLWPVRVRVRVSFMTGAIRSAILAAAGRLYSVCHSETTWPNFTKSSVCMMTVGCEMWYIQLSESRV